MAASYRATQSDRNTIVMEASPSPSGSPMRPSPRPSLLVSDVAESSASGAAYHPPTPALSGQAFRCDKCMRQHQRCEMPNGNPPCKKCAANPDGCIPPRENYNKRRKSNRPAATTTAAGEQSSSEGRAPANAGRKTDNNRSKSRPSQMHQMEADEQLSHRPTAATARAQMMNTRFQARAEAEADPLARMDRELQEALEQIQDTAIFVRERVSPRVYEGLILDWTEKLKRDATRVRNTAAAWADEAMQL